MTKSARLVVPEEFLTALQKKINKDLIQQAWYYPFLERPAQKLGTWELRW